jgi:hypothetical protein
MQGVHCIGLSSSAAVILLHFSRAIVAGYVSIIDFAGDKWFGALLKSADPVPHTGKVRCVYRV